jgi:hypothetical protein
LNRAITEAVAALGVTGTTLSELVNERSGISPEMAVRLSKVSAEARKAGSCNRRSTMCASADRMKLKRLGLA